MDAPHDYAREKAREAGLAPLPVLRIASDSSCSAVQQPAAAVSTDIDAEAGGDGADESIDDATRALDAEALLEKIEQCPWEVEVSRVALLSWRDSAEVLRLAALRKLHAIASGVRSARLAKPLNLSNAPGAALFESYLPSGWRLLWEETVAFSERHQTARDCILLWDLCNHDDAQRRIQDIGRRHRAAARPGAAGGGAPPRDPNEPLRLPRDHGPAATAAPSVAGPTLLLAALAPGRSAAQPAAAPERGAEGRAAKPRRRAQGSADGVVLRSVRERAAALARGLLAGRAPAGAEAALAAAAEAEAGAVCADEPVLLLGRSGTGKTSCALLRLWSRYRAYWEASRGRELLLSGHLRQVFLASSPALCREVRSWFARLEEGHALVLAQGGAAGPAEPRLPGRESHELPDSLAALTDDAFPLFVTTAKWLEMVDGGLPRPFFARDEAGRVRRHAPGPDSELGAPLPAGAQALVGGARGGEGEPLAAGGQRAVGYEGFTAELWPAVAVTKGEKNLHPLVAWTEIVSHITGSLESLGEAGGCLSEDDYLALGRARSRLEPSQRKCVYAVFERYRAEKRRRGLYDRMDAVHVVYRELAREGYRGPAVHEVLVDEVQDLTQAELWLLFCTTDDPRAFFLAGDTAQTVSRGVGFRFADLRTLFHHEAKVAGRARRLATSGLPVRQLTCNYRSKSGVLGLASAVLDAIEALFEREIDHLARDAGLVPGPRPLLFREPALLGRFLFGAEAEAEGGAPLGADQVVLVRSAAARSRLPARLQRAIVLTVEESKGLEWGDVVVFNFFRDSALADGRAWKEAARACGDAVRAGAAVSAAAPAPAAGGAARAFEDLDAARGAEKGEKGKKAATAAAAGGAGRVLASELKHLYTAVSRARTNVWIFEEDEERGRPMLDLFAAAGVAQPWGKTEEEAEPERPRAAESGPEEWAARGREYLARGLYEAASRAFEYARDSRGGERARALGAVARAASAANEKGRKAAYREASGLFAAAGEAVNAARCLYSAGDFAKAALCFEQAGEGALAAEAHEAGGSSAKAIQMYAKMGWLRHALAVADRAGLMDECLRLVKQHPDLYYVDRSAATKDEPAAVRKDRAYFVAKAAGAAADAGDIAALVDTLAIDEPKLASKLIAERGLGMRVREELARRDPHLGLDERKDLYARMGVSIQLASSTRMPEGVNSAQDIEASIREAQDVVDAGGGDEMMRKTAEDMQERISRSELCRFAREGEAMRPGKFCSFCPREKQPRNAAGVSAHNATEEHTRNVEGRDLYYRILCTRPEEMFQRMALQVERLGQLASQRPRNGRSLIQLKEKLLRDRQELTAMSQGFAAERKWDVFLHAMMMKQPEYMKDIEEADRLTGMEPAQWDDRYSISMVAIPEDEWDGDGPAPSGPSSRPSAPLGPQPGPRAQAGYGAAPAAAAVEANEEPFAETRMSDAELQRFALDRIFSSAYSTAVIEAVREEAEEAGFEGPACEACDLRKLPKRPTQAALEKHRASPEHREQERLYHKLVLDLATICEDALDAVRETADALAHADVDEEDYAKLEKVDRLLLQMGDMDDAFLVEAVAVARRRAWAEGYESLCMAMRLKCVELVEEAEDLAGLPRRCWRRWPHGKTALTLLGPRAFRAQRRLPTLGPVAPPPPPSLAHAPCAPGGAAGAPAQRPPSSSGPPSAAARGRRAR